MSVNNQSHPVFKIVGNPQLQRYISLEKFISMLHRGSLFFARIDCLEDPFEGTSPRVVRQAMKAFYERINKEGYFKGPITDNVIANEIAKQEAFTEKIRPLYIVNCWHNCEDENALMWKSYSANNNGIMIKSNYNRIRDSLLHTEDSIQTSVIKYVDYKKSRNINFGNTLYPTWCGF